MPVIQVKMLVSTVFGGSRLHPGDVIGVMGDVAERWAKRGIAELIAQDITKLSAKQLYSLCKERGIDAEPKLQKADYLELLSAEGGN